MLLLYYNIIEKKHYNLNYFFKKNLIKKSFISQKRNRNQNLVEKQFCFFLSFFLIQKVPKNRTHTRYVYS